MRGECIGRKWERAQLAHLIAEAQAGRGALVLISGESGVGKTTLLEWALGEAVSLQTAVSRCTGPGETPPFGPWQTLAEQTAGVPWPAPLLATGPSLSDARAHGYDLAGTVAHAVRTAGSSLLLAIEDLQWADAASLDLLRQLTGHVQRLPLLILATYRRPDADALPPVLAELQRTGAVRLPLSRFTAEEVLEFAASALPEHPEAAVMARYLHLRTGGHPLFVSELLAVARAGGTPDGPLPETVQQAMEQHLRRLPPGAVPVLQAAAVVGEQFSYDLLLQVADASEEAVLTALEAALALRLLRTVGDTGQQFAFDHALVREVLLGQVIGPRRRHWHLRVAEALLGGGGAGSWAATEPETVALHLERAGDPRAVAYLILAGDRALRLGARSEAKERYEQALALLMAPGRSTAAPDLHRAETLLKLAHATEGAAARAYCAEALTATESAGDPAAAVWARHLQATWHAEDGHPGALEGLLAVQQAQETLLKDERYQRLEIALYGDALAYPRINPTLALALTKAGRADEAHALVADMQARTRPGDRRTAILRVQWWMASLMGRWDDALELGQRLIEAFQAEGDERACFRVASNRLYHALLCKADEPAAVDAVAAEMLRLAERVTAVSGYDPLAAGHPPLGWYSYLRGDWDGARRHLLGYLERHPHDADPGVRGFAAMLQLATGDTAGARATLQAVPPLHPDEDPGLHAVQLSAYTMRSGLCLAEGDVDGARAWLDAAERYRRRRGGTAFRASLRLAWARFYLAAGDIDSAYAEAEQALAEAQAPREFRVLIAASRLLGELAARLGRPVEAAAHLQEALALAERCHYPYEVAMTRLSQAEALAGAPADLSAVRATLERLGARPALARLEAFAGAQPNARAPESARTIVLSSRELEVARLVARGLSDKEIAVRLTISPRTVDGHLRRIFAKAGVSSRAALAAHAVRQGWL